MAITGLEWWYDGQQRRFLEQIVRAFSGFQYMTGRRNGQDPQLRMVPCRMASRNRMVAQIMRNNSENTLLTCPLITVDQTTLTPRRNDLQNPAHVDTRAVRERAIDSVTGEYTSESGNRYLVKRLMPRPFEMGIEVDIWTSNLDQKHQLSEQILTVFMPDIEIQNSDNALDWSARTILTLDDVTWTSKSLPIGTEDEIDVMTLQFKLPMWLSPPAQVTQEKLIQQIVSNINEGDVHHSASDPDALDAATLRAQVITTPGDNFIEVDAIEGTLKLLGPKTAELDPDGNVYRWDALLEQYGNLRPTISTVRLKRDADIESENDVVGTIQFDTNRPNYLFWQIDPDTLPTNTLQPIKGVIDPLRTHPAAGITPVEGDRYLLLNDVGNVGTTTLAWGTLAAKTNDIIQYTSGQWVVSFDAASTSTTQTVVNLFSGTQLRWTGEEWVLAVGGQYGPGYWRIYL